MPIGSRGERAGSAGRWTRKAGQEAGSCGVARLHRDAGTSGGQRGGPKAARLTNGGLGGPRERGLGSPVLFKFF